MILFAIVISIVFVWTSIEYYFHRIVLHGELNIGNVEDGKRNAAIFSKHIHHHVFMN